MIRGCGYAAPACRKTSRDVCAEQVKVASGPHGSAIQTASFHDTRLSDTVRSEVIPGNRPQGTARVLAA